MPIPRPQKFQSGRAIVDSEGRPTNEFLRFVNSMADALASLVDVQNAADAANAAAAAANAAATNAQNAADSTAAETSLVNSFVTNFTPPVISVDSAGIVTVANHDRQYGDTTLNPTASVIGDTLFTGEPVAAVIRVYYDDPTRAGGAVTYQWTVDPVTPPVQGGDRHVVGAVEVPGAGSSDGGWVQPPGYTGPIP